MSAWIVVIPAPLQPMPRACEGRTTGSRDSAQLGSGNAVRARHKLTWMGLKCVNFPVYIASYAGLLRADRGSGSRSRSSAHAGAGKHIRQVRGLLTSPTTHSTCRYTASYWSCGERAPKRPSCTSTDTLCCGARCLPALFCRGDAVLLINLAGNRRPIVRGADTVLPVKL